MRVVDNWDEVMRISSHTKNRDVIWLQIRHLLLDFLNKQKKDEKVAVQMLFLLLKWSESVKSLFSNTNLKDISLKWYSMC